MKKRTIAISLVFIGPTLLAGCSSSQNRDGYCDPNNPNDPDCSTRSGGYRGTGGHFYGGSRSGGSASPDSGGFGSTGRGFFSFGS